MNLDTLDTLSDNELKTVIGRSQELLTARDEERKVKAIAEARSLLAAVGLTPMDLAGKGKGAKHGTAKAPTYHSGQQYQHPTNKCAPAPQKSDVRQHPKPRPLSGKRSKRNSSLNLSLLPLIHFAILTLLMYLCGP